MSKRKFSPRQRQLLNTLAEANYRTRTILADRQLRMEAQLTSNRLYTAFIKKYFPNEWPTIEPAVEKKVKTRRKSR